MPKSRQPLKVFLCHTHADREAVHELYTRLTNDGVDVWLDEEKLLPGQAWRDVIEESVRNSDIVIVCLSNQAVTKEGFVQKEVKIALDVADEKPEDAIFVIPARLDECIVPRRLKDLQWVDLYEDGGYSKLLKGLKLRVEQLEKIKTHKEEVVKRRLPYFETPMSPNQVIHQDSKYTYSATQKNGDDVSVKKSKNKRRIKTEYIVAIIGAVATMMAGFLSSPLIEKWLSPEMSIPITTATLPLSLPMNTLTSTPEVKLISTVTATDTQSVTFNLTPTKDVVATPVVAFTEIMDDKGIPMMLVPTGTFIMGSEHRHSDEQPVHVVNLDAYYVDKYEVTNASYKTCVIMGGCASTHSIANNYRFDYYENPVYENYPVAMVDWDQANAYCEWRGARLPTEAEWEKASRGVDGGIYPWGDDNNFDCSYANYYGCEGDTNQVGSYEKGKSPYGIYDMVGNVSEWVYDWYGSDYYAAIGSNASNPQGPSTPSYGYTHIIRGGSYIDLSDSLRSSLRSPNLTAFHSTIGFRCAKDAP